MDLRVSSNNKGEISLPQPATDFRTIFESLPIKVITKEVAIPRILRICPQADAVWLQRLPIDHLERVYRRRMNVFKPHSGTKTFVVASADEVERKLAEVKQLLASKPLNIVPEPRIGLDDDRELAEMSA